MPNWKKIILNGGSGELTTLKLTSLTEDNTGTKVLTLDASNNIKLTGSFGGGGGTLSGDGAVSRIPYYDGITTFTNESGFTYTEASDKLTVGNVALGGGSVGSPSLYFGGRTSTGLWWDYSPNTINITRNATNIIEVSTNTKIASGVILSTNGSTTAPSYAFTNDADTGMYLSSVGNLGFTVGNAQRFKISTTEITSLLPHQGSDGSKSTPQYSFGNDTDTGMYLGGNGILSFTTTGNNRLILSDTYTEVENTLKLDNVTEGSGISRYLVWDSGDDNSVKWQTVSTSGVTSVTGTAPIVSSGGTTPAISINAATTSAAGSMSSTDKTKLDGLVLNSLVQTSGVQSIAGVKTFSSLPVFSNGINIGSTSYSLFVYSSLLYLTAPAGVISIGGGPGGANNDLRISNGSLAVGSITNSSTNGRIDASNDVVAYSTSDEKLKKYIKNIKNPLEKISKINGVTFEWKKTDDKIKKEVHSFEGNDVGVIAQEIEKVLPEVVQTRDNGYKAVRYEKIIPLLIEAIKDQQKQIDELKSKL